MQTDLDGSAKMDKELLELAAKAAGMGIKWNAETNCYYHEPQPVSWTARKWWNPLDDDGDALRLAVKCDIEFYRADDEGLASYAGYWGKTIRGSISRMFAIEYDDDINNMGDPLAATRRAIVRAAAEIGRGMP